MKRMEGAENVKYAAHAVTSMAEDPARWTDYQLGLHCGITLAGIKAGSLVCVPARDTGRLCGALKKFSARGIEYAPLRLCNGRVGILVYAKSKLESVLKEERVKSFLGEFGYKYDGVEEAIAALRTKIALNNDFPHEIGIFLGYPPEDVRGFLERRQAKLTGYWRVYDDEESARKIFLRYDKCGSCICKRLMQGETLEQIFDIK